MGKMDKDTEIINQMALGLANQGKFEEAVVYFKKSLRIKPDGQIYYLLGLTYQKLKKLDDAEKSFKQALLMNENMPQPYNGLGLIYFGRGLYQLASKYYKLTLKRNPYDFAAYNNLGNAYKKMDKNREAVKCYLKASKIAPQKPEPYNNLGTVYFQENEFKKSEKYLKKAIEVDPNYAMAYFHLGVLNRRLNKFNEAIKYLIKYNTFNPNHAENYRILGGCYLDQDNLAEAKKYFDQAYKMNPNSAFTNNDLGNYYRKTYDRKEAVKYYQKAIELDLGFAGAHSNLGIALGNIEKINLALKHIDRAIKLDPKCFEAYYHLGLIYEKVGNSHKAKEAYQKTLEVNPDFFDAVGALVSNLMQNCDWDGLPVYERHLDKAKNFEPALLSLARKMDEKQNLESARVWSKGFSDLAASSGIKFEFKRWNKNKKIRIGYLSCDFYNHATAHLMLGLFARHNRSKFEIFTYSYGIDDKSDYRKKIMADSDHFIDISNLSNIEAAQKINNDKIDILIDLKGHTRDSRFEIAALKPAPIQVSWLGFPGTTGASFIDYIITDKIVTPSMKYYTEKPIYLPCYQVNDNEQKIQDSRFKRQDFKLPEKGIVFASFNATYKITKEVFVSWLRILKEVPDSVLWIYAPGKNAQSNLRKAASIAGLNLARLVFAGNLPKDEHLARIRLAGIALDTFTYNGHTTTSDCLWAGVPVITLKGNHFASRVSASLLTAIGLPELITNSVAEYEHLAIDLALNPQKLLSIRHSLDAKRLTAPLFNTKLFVKNLEDAYVKMIQDLRFRIHE